MNWKMRIALLSILVAVGAHMYLSFHYYPLHLGFAEGEAICSFSEKFNCDAVSASRFSALFGVPMAVWGAATNLVLLLMLLVYGFGMTENLGRQLRVTVLLAGFVAFTSLVMGSISMFYLGTYCPFCIVAYVTSFITFEALRRNQTEPFFSHIGGDIKSAFGDNKAYLGYAAGIPILAVFSHFSIIQHYGAENLDKVVRASVLDWQASASADFDLPPLLAKGAGTDQAKMTIVEFADFRCGHCKKASIPLTAFVRSKTDVRLQFYVFPLDGACNDAISRAEGGSCRLAKSVLCAEKSGKGWALHDEIFGNQETLNRKHSVDETDWELKEYAKNLGLDFEELKS
ncbi:MAG: DsbA family protein, partial [Bdellovibrionales bacterium]|nr:DsbA family protein [Bdellovibrionales bacterium]